MVPWLPSHAYPRRNYGDHVDLNRNISYFEKMVYNDLKFEILKMIGMSAAGTILAITFILFVSITLVAPSFPPVQLLYKYLRIPQTTLSFNGISVATLLNGIINGLFWTIFAALTYGLAQLAITARELKPLPPMPFAPHLTTPLPENLLVVSKGSIIPAALTIPPTTRSFTKRRKPAKRSTKAKSVPMRVSKKRTQLKMSLVI